MSKNPEIFENDIVDESESNDDMESLDGKYFTYCLDENLDDVFIETKNMIICSLKLSCYCYINTPFYNNKLFVYIKPDEHGIITFRRLFTEYDRLMGIELERITSNYEESYYCNHIFVEMIEKISDIQYELWCGS
jgi:hypothetical protein